MARKKEPKEKRRQVWLRFTDAVYAVAEKRFEGEWTANEAISDYPFRLERPEGSAKVQPVRYFIKDPSDDAAPSFKPKMLRPERREQIKKLGKLRREAVRELRSLIETGDLPVRLELRHAPSIVADALHHPMIFGQMKSLETSSKIRMRADGEWHVATVTVSEDELSRHLVKDAGPAAPISPAGLTGEALCEVETIVDRMREIRRTVHPDGDHPEWGVESLADVISQRTSTIFSEESQTAIDWGKEVPMSRLRRHIENLKSELSDLLKNGRGAPRKDAIIARESILEELNKDFPESRYDADA